MNPIKTAAAFGRKMIQPAVKVCQKVKTSKPEIFVGVGVVAVIGSFVWVAIEAAKAPDVMTETSEKVKDIEDRYSDEKLKQESLNQPDALKTLIKLEKKDLTKARADGVIQMAKLFGGPVIVLGIGCGLIVRGHQILKMRNAVLGAALKSTEKLFDFYRSNVIREQGPEADKRYLRGIVGETEVKTVALDENGNEIVKTETVPVIQNASQTANPWLFEFTPQYFKQAKGIPDIDLSAIAGAEEYFNHLYSGPKRHGDISMYEVLEFFRPDWDAIDPTGERRVIARNYGWGHDEKGDERIDLGRFRAVNDPVLHGASDKVFIEMNCDGRLENLKNRYKVRYLQA